MATDVKSVNGKAATEGEVDDQENAERIMEIPPIEIGRALVRVEQMSPLIVNRFSEKAKKQMLDKQMKKAMPAKEAKDPEALFRSSLYVIPGTEKMTDFEPGKYFLPGVMFKKAAVGGCRYVDGITMEKAKGLFFVSGDGEGHGDPVLEFDEIVMREDAVRNATGVADLRFRAQFNNWAAELDINYNKRAIAIEQVVNLLNAGGFGQGVGEWRPSAKKGGEFGRFHVVSVKEMT